jgi:hypothetical protein
VLTVFLQVTVAFEPTLNPLIIRIVLNFYVYVSVYRDKLAAFFSPSMGIEMERFERVV